MMVEIQWLKHAEVVSFKSEMLAQHLQGSLLNLSICGGLSSPI